MKNNDNLFNLFLLILLGFMSAIYIIIHTAYTDKSAINISKELNHIEIQLNEINSQIIEMQDAIEELQSFHKESEDNR